MFSSTGEMLGSRPVTLNLFWRTALSLAVIGSTAIFLLDVSNPLYRRHTPSKHGVSDLRPFCYLSGPFVLSYCALLVPRGLYSFLYDRYLLGVLPFAVLCVLLLYQRRVRSSLPRWVFAVLTLCSAYVVLATHDWFALNRARLQAVAAVQARTALPVTRIQGGFDFDGWTQLQNAPSVNWQAVVNPPGTYHRYPPDSALAPACHLNFAPYTPVIKPDYFVVFQPMTCLAPAQLGPVAYTNWLPPHIRYVYIQKRPN